MSPSQRPLSLECFRVDEIVDVGAGVVTFFLRGGVLAVVRLEEPKGAPLATSLAHLVDGAVDLIMTASLKALAAPPARLASTWPKTIFRPVVSGITSPTVAILLWGVKGEVVVQVAPETDLPSFVLLRLLLPWLFCCRLLLLWPLLLLRRGRGVTFRFILQLWKGQVVRGRDRFDIERMGVSRSRRRVEA